jgi:hypothetical protein
MSDRSLVEHQRTLHRRAEEVLTRFAANDALLAQVRAGLDASARGERGVPFREIKQRRQARKPEA